jgi:hypothetical protein
MANTEPVRRRSFLARWLSSPPQPNPVEEIAVHPDVRFEHTDIHARGVVFAGISLLIAIWIIVLLLQFVFHFFANYRAEESPRPIPLASEQNRLPPAPILQVAPRQDLGDFRAYEDSKLNSYTWVDRQKGIVGIPIERAMELLSARGIAPQKTPADLKLVPPTAGTRMTGLEGKVEPEPR